MRPISLKIKGINSFTEEQTVNFDLLTKNGLFGIVGDTGSGKSSILDAMTIALYGELSRDTNEFINKEIDTASVVFDFAIDDVGRECVYRAERSFKRRENKECVNGIARLTKINQQPEIIADKTRDMNKAVEKLIGLSFGDFTRTVVLPQGKFSQFLELKGADRRAMLERVFGLEKYGSLLAQKLKVQRNKSSENLTMVNSKLEVYGDISKEDFEEKQKELNAGKEAFKNMLERLEQLKKRAAEAEKVHGLTEKMKICQRDLKECELERQSIDQFSAQIGIEKPTLEELNEKLGAFRQAVKLCQEAKELNTMADNSKSKLAAENRERERHLTKLNNAGVAVKNAATAVDTSEKLRQALAVERSRDMEELIKGGDKLKEAREKAYGSKEAYNKQNELHRELNRLLAEIMAEQDKMAVILSETNAAEQRKGNIEAELKKLEQGIALMKDKNMAAILAKNLKDGECCPVCGSKEHPMPAENIGMAVIEAMEKEFEDMRQKLGKAEKNLNRLNSELTAINRVIADKTSEKTSREKEAGGVSLAELKTAYNRAVEEYRAEEKLAEERKKAREKEEKYLKAEEAEKIARKTFEQAMENKNQAEKKLLDCEAQIKIISAELRRLIDEADKKNKEALDITGECDASELVRKTEDALEIVKNYSRKKSLAEDSLNSIETELNGRSITDEEFLEINNSLKDMTEKRETASNSIAIMEKELEQLKQNLTVVEQLKVEKNKLQRHHDMIVEISRLTEGNKLVEYMAESRLEYIAADASMRLKSISGGRYALELLAGEFIIRDDFCGGIRRRPTTLSGGETFLTSFALALALSDRIQMKNRSSLKFFFLDEGFGTLDKNSLDTVMKSLEVLCRTGMTVGLITHVEEVKERLMVKLNVDAAIPGKSGSTVSIKY